VRLPLVIFLRRTGPILKLVRPQAVGHFRR